MRYIHLDCRQHRLPQAETLQTLELRKSAVERPLKTAFVALQPVNHVLSRD
ncbi:MAG: hypothetical protein LAN62_10035 [Acidobacteriia bacterium]|nr:hypothetical protein [Terriglobia bacterium]